MRRGEHIGIVDVSRMGTHHFVLRLVAAVGAALANALRAPDRDSVAEIAIGYCTVAALAEAPAVGRYSTPTCSCCREPVPLVAYYLESKLCEFSVRSLYVSSIRRHYGLNNSSSWRHVTKPTQVHVYI